MKRHIALVEDDEQLRKNYADALRREGYEISAHRDRQTAMQAFQSRLPDMAILDIMLGEEMEGGFELCRQLRSLSAVIPIIFLTARNSDVDKVSGLRLGAWDYMVKDTTTLDFLPVRVTALFKAIDAIKLPTSESLMQRGSLTIDADRKQVFWRGSLIPLTLTEFWILQALVKHPGHVKSHAQLMDAANVIITDNAVTAHIRRLRNKFRDVDADFSSIKSEYGMGYRWMESS
jgi:two-component system OmpR family response regulator